MKRCKMPDTEMLLIIEYLNQGLVPYSVDLLTALDSMTPEDSRKSKRKFRKQHRKARKNSVQKVEERITRKGWMQSGASRTPPRQIRAEKIQQKIETVEDAWGKAAEIPRHHQKSERKQLVFGKIYQEVTKRSPPLFPLLHLFSK